MVTIQTNSTISPAESYNWSYQSEESDEHNPREVRKSNGKVIHHTAKPDRECSASQIMDLIISHPKALGSVSMQTLVETEYLLQFSNAQSSSHHQFCSGLFTLRNC